MCLIFMRLHTAKALIMLSINSIYKEIEAATDGLTFAEVARAASIRKATMSDIMSRKVIPRISTVEKILTACKSLKKKPSK